MQKLAPVSLDRNPNQHTDAEVLAALQGATGARRFSFRYELLTLNNTYVQDLSNVLSCRIEENWLADIKRTATMVLRETGVIDFLSDRIRPSIRTHLPPYGKDDWVEHPQGVFLLTSPDRDVDPFGVVTREIQCYDPLQVFSDDLHYARYFIANGNNVVDVVSNILGAIPKVVTPATAVIPAGGADFEPGTSKLKIINTLLSSINYESLSFDEDGRAIVQPYRSPQERAEEYEYAADSHGLILPNVSQELDLFSVPNRWTLIVSDPDRPELIASYTNSDPASPTSTVRRGRIIADFRTEQDAVDLTTLQAKAIRLAFEASQIYEAIPFETAMMPIHSGNDVYRLKYPALAVNAKYAEQSWTLELKAGSKMAHRARRVVTI